MTIGWRTARGVGAGRGRAPGLAGAVGVAAFLAIAGSALTALTAAEPVTYRFSFPEVEHRWMQVEATFPGVGSGPIDLRMSRASPGRYSLHDFAKNVYDVHVLDAGGREIAATRPDPYGWRVEGHGGAVTVRYKVFGDRIDGTYLAIDTTHAHINMPAVVMFARGLDDRGAVVRFEPPAGRTGWRVATQLMPGADPLEFTAPNLQYLMDSPAEFANVTIVPFTVDGHAFRFALHHAGSADEVASFAGDVEKIVREQRTIFGEYPAYEPGAYTFLADYLPYASGDGMEHRNSTVLTSSGAIANSRNGLLGTVAHEFFHNWNVERIRPRSLEPFDFENANPSAELWLAEGFTQYYGPLALSRAGLADLTTTAFTLTDLVSSVVLSPAHLVRSAEDMSRMAAFTDGGQPVDRTNWSVTYTSYYPFGGAIALALDLTLRERFDGRLSLDDFMRAMWRVHGKPGGSRPGYVDRPYTLADAEARLADVTESPEFAREFFARYIHGHEVADYETLLKPAGFVLRRTHAREAWLGPVKLEQGPRGMRLSRLTVPGTPAYAAGLERGDEIVELGGQKTDTEERVASVLRSHKPGDTLPLVLTDRSGTSRTTTITLAADPAFEVVPVERAGATPTAAQRAFRHAWLDSHQ